MGLNTFLAPERNRVCRRCAVALMSAARIVGVLFVLLAVGCAGLERVLPIDPPAAPSEAPSTAQLAARADSPAPKTLAKLVAPPVPTERVPKKESAAPAPVKQAPPPLDLKSLETRLKETEAIGVFTKLALKKQVGDLLDTFRAFYQGRLKSTLAELRRPYDLLLLKLLALLQDSDPPLAAAIVASREAIWGILADPDKFTTL